MKNSARTAEEERREKTEPKNTKAAEPRKYSGEQDGHWVVTNNENATAKESALSGSLDNSYSSDPLAFAQAPTACGVLTFSAHPSHTAFEARSPQSERRRAVSYKEAGRQEERKSETRTHDGSFEVEEVEFDPTRRGYTKVPNYFAYYWTPLLGPKVALTFERLRSFAHGDKEECHPSVGLLADVLGIDRHDLTGRVRRDRREGRQSEYYQKGIFQILAEHGLLRVDIEDGPNGRHYKFKTLKYPPSLTTEQLAQLPPRLQRKHQALLDRCQKEREEFFKPPASYPHKGSDGATEGAVTAPDGGCDGATGDLNTTELTAQKEHLSSPSSSEEVKVREFYQHIGQPKVSRQKVKAGVQILADLKSQGFSLVDIVWAMTWIVSHQDLFGGKVHSLALLPQVISQALQEREAEKQQKAKKQSQAQGDQRLKAEQARRQELDRLYQSLSPNEQAALREVAVDGLLQSGIEQRFLVEPLIRGEVCRLLEARSHQSQ